MTAIVQILSFVLIALTAGYLLKVTLSDMLPFVWCSLIAVLYVLSFARALKLIDFIAPACAAGLVVYVFLLNRKKENSDCGFGSYVIDNVRSAGFITYLILCIAIPLCQSARIVTWWDDINYWASDLKSLYALGGFAARYANVSPQFGDYPPGIQLAKWYLVHMDPRRFRESLAFTGYYLFNLSFLMPLFKNIKGRKAVVSPLLALAAWGFAGIGEIYGYGGFCADLSMAFLFGSILICAARRTEPDLIRTSLYLSVLVIAKSTGMIWALFAFIIWLVYRYLDVTRVTSGETAGNEPDTLSSRRDLIRSGLCVIAGPALAGGAWMLFCLVHRRVTQTTSTMVTYITTDRYGLSPYKDQFKSAFIKAFFTEPAHVTHTWFDLPPAAMFVLIVILLAVLRLTGVIRGRAGTFVCIALPVMGLVYYVLIFIAHLTIFATETQYLEPEGMIASIERYGAPFILGCFLFISALWLESDRRQLAVRVFLVAVLVLTNIPEAYRGLMGYRMELNDELHVRSEFKDDESRKFIECLSRDLYPGEEGSAYSFPKGGTRVCRVRDGAYYRVADTYTAYEASPVSVMSVSFDLKDASPEFFAQCVGETHASYVYLDQQPYSETFLDAMTESGRFEYRRLYRITYENGGMKLQ